MRGPYHLYPNAEHSFIENPELGSSCLLFTWDWIPAGMAHRWDGKRASWCFRAVRNGGQLSGRLAHPIPSSGIHSHSLAGLGWYAGDPEALWWTTWSHSALVTASSCCSLCWWHFWSWKSVMSKIVPPLKDHQGEVKPWGWGSLLQAKTMWA